MRAYEDRLWKHTPVSVQVHSLAPLRLPHQEQFDVTSLRVGKEKKWAEVDRLSSPRPRMVGGRLVSSSVPEMSYFIMYEYPLETKNHPSVFEKWVGRCHSKKVACERT